MGRLSHVHGGKAGNLSNFAYRSLRKLLLQTHEGLRERPPSGGRVPCYTTGHVRALQAVREGLYRGDSSQKRGDLAPAWRRAARRGSDDLRRRNRCHPRLAAGRSRRRLRGRSGLQARRGGVCASGFRLRGGARDRWARGARISGRRRPRCPRCARRPSLRRLRRPLVRSGGVRRHRHQWQDDHLVRSVLHPHGGRGREGGRALEHGGDHPRRGAGRRGAYHARGRPRCSVFWR